MCEETYEDYEDNFANLVITRPLYKIHVSNDTELPYHLRFKAAQFGSIRELGELVIPKVQAGRGVYGHIQVGKRAYRRPLVADSRRWAGNMPTMKR